MSSPPDTTDTPAAPGPARKPRTMGDKAAATGAGHAPVQAPAPNNAPARQPRVIASTSTAVAPVVPQDAAVQHQEPVNTVTPATATTPTPRPMPGKVVMGVRVTAAALAQRFPDQSAATRTTASAVLATIVPASLGWADAQRIGIGLQQRYGEQVQRLLDAMAADAVRTAPQHLSRLITLLETCAEQLIPPTGIGQWLRKDKVRPADLHSREIEQLKSRLSRLVAELEPTMAQVMKIRDDMATLAGELLATGMACEWLSDDASLASEVRNALTERALALTKTLALVRQQQEQSTATAMGLDALRDRIHDGVLNALPSWLAHLATLPPELNDTQRYVVRDELAQIIYRLKK